MNEMFKVELVTYIDEYEDMVAEIYYNDKFLVLLNQDNGIDDINLEFNLSDIGSRKLQVNLKYFEEAVDFAKKRLWELRRIEE